MNIKISVRGQNLTAVVKHDIVSDSIMYLTFTADFDEMWDELTKIVYFERGNLRVPVNIGEAEIYHVPPMVLSGGAGMLRISAVGLGDDGVSRITTKRMANAIPIRESGAFDAQGDVDENEGNAIYTQTIRDQIYSALGQANAVYREVQEKLTSGELRGDPLKFEDLTPEEKEELRGVQGPAGEQGPVGPQGIPGSTVKANGMYGFHVSEEGHLILSYVGDEKPPLSMNADGHLILTI